ncbi:MAG: NACHT domain-containing protein [Anaerolineales bacterium]
MGFGRKPEEISSEATKQQNRTFFDKNEFSKVGAFFERNEEISGFFILALILALWIGIFIYAPAYILFWSSANINWLFVLAGIICGIAISLLVWLLHSTDFEKVLLAISIIGLSPYVAIGIFLFRLNDPLSNKVLYTVIGTILGLIAIAIIRRISNKDEEREKLFTKNLRQIFVQQNHIAILGKPGAGKSTLVQFIALTFARAKAGDRKLRRTNIVKQKLGLDTWYFPILIPLRKVAKHLIDEDTDGGTNLLIEIWKDKILPSDIRADLPDGLIHRLLKQNRCIILLDGLDEVADDNEFKMVAKEIRGFSSRYNGNKFILTSRFAGWRGGVGSAFQEFELDDLGDQQILSFINSWYHAIEENRIVGGVQNESESERTQRFRIARSKAKNLIDAFENVEGIRHLAKNPLLLSLICFVHYNQALPRERLSLYLECSKLLLMQWDLEKGIVIDDTDLTLKQKEAIIG